jgi:hypothetical protein
MEEAAAAAVACIIESFADSHRVSDESVWFSDCTMCVLRPDFYV